MTDQIFVRGLALYAHHGLLAHETANGQRFSLDLDIDIDLQAAAASDDIADTADYGGMVREATRVFTGQRFKLIEAAAGAVADHLLAQFPRVQRVRVTIHKPHAPVAALFADIGVAVTRSRGA